MILSYLESITPGKFLSGGFLDKFHSKRPVNSSVDWFRCTNTSLKGFHDAMRKFTPLLVGHGFNFVELGSGLGNYKMAYQIQFNGQVCGSICADNTEGESNIGGMFDLSGAGCQLLQGRWDLWCCLVVGLKEYGFNIKRLDVAVDFKGKVWNDFDVNIMTMNDMINEGMLSTTKLGNKPSISLVGDWSELLYSGVTSSDYMPSFHALGGCTINVGKRTSCSSWCVYEKGKQMAGKNPDIYDDSMFDWVRIERRFSQGSGRSKKEISFEFALYPDQAFIYQCEGVEKFLGRWFDFQVSRGVDIPSGGASDGVDLERPSMSAKVSFRKSAIHATQHAGRFLKSLVMLGIDPMKWVDKAVGDEPVRGFCVDFHADFDLDEVLGGSYA